MTNRKILLSFITITALTTTATFAEEESSLEVSGYIKTEIGAYTGDGSSLNSNEPHKAGDIQKEH